MLLISTNCSKYFTGMIYLTLDVYRTFCGEPMHDCSHEISPLIKDCTANSLKDETHLSSSTKTKSGEGCTFSFYRKTVSCARNKFMHVVEHTSIGYDLYTYFSK